jgi:hypothetical protein
MPFHAQNGTRNGTKGRFVGRPDIRTVTDSGTEWDSGTVHVANNKIIEKEKNNSCA